MAPVWTRGKLADRTALLPFERSYALEDADALVDNSTARDRRVGGPSELGSVHRDSWGRRGSSMPYSEGFKARMIERMAGSEGISANVVTHPKRGSLRLRADPRWLDGDG